MTNPTSCRDAFEKWARSQGRLVCPGRDGYEYSSMQVENEWMGWQAAWNTRPTEGDAVAEVVSKYGDPERFGEREIVVIGDLFKIPYNTKLYTHPCATSDEVERLKQFVALMFKATDWPDGGDVDGFEFQNIAVKCGLLHEVEMQERCGDSCQCAEMGADFPAQCFRKTPLYYECAALAERGEVGNG